MAHDSRLSDIEVLFLQAFKGDTSAAYPLTDAVLEFLADRPLDDAVCTVMPRYSEYDKACYVRLHLYKRPWHFMGGELGVEATVTDMWEKARRCTNMFHGLDVFVRHFPDWWLRNALHLIRDEVRNAALEQNYRMNHLDDPTTGPYISFGRPERNKRLRERADRLLGWENHTT